MVDNDMPAIEFTAFDRCDGCGAQAHALARQEGKTELLFCIHHLRDYKDPLLEEGWEIVEDWEAIEALYYPSNEYPAPV